MDYEEYYDYLNKEISNYTAIAVDNQTLTLNITFAKPSDMSTDINDLDYLIIKFLMREQIVDAENYKYIAHSKLQNHVEIAPQYTQAEIEALISFKEKMKKVGASISAFLFILYIALNKSASAMNKLMLQMQFFVYI